MTKMPSVHAVSLLVLLSISSWHLGETTNPRPIIGVLTQETDPANVPFYGDTYLPSNYVVYLQSAGARVVPIRVKQSMEYYKYMFNSINGVLFPGGGENLQTSEFAKAAKVFYDMALKANDAGDYFPVWGTCQGFQMLMTLTANKNPLSNVSLYDKAIPVQFTKDARDSKLFRSVPDNIFDFLKTKNVTENFHNFGVTLKTYTYLNSLRQFYHVLSTNLDDKGLEYVSTAEAYNYPVYAVQWHPEKPMTTWNTHYHINHGPEAISVSQYMANFLVGEARKSEHKFPSMKDELEASIENYMPVFHKDYTFDSYYYFNFTEV